jgi:tight adherence protein B
VENQTLLALLGTPVLLGTALLAILRAERRRQTLQQRLQSFATVAPGADAPGAALLRPRPKRSLRNIFLLPGFRARLDAALAAAGNRIGVTHLALTGMVAASVAAVFANRVMAFQPVLVILLAAAAAVAAPLLLLRFARSRYQRRFLDIFPDALDLIGRAVKAGLPVVDAMEVAAHEVRAPVGNEFRRTLDEMHIGVEIDEALQHTADRIRIPDFRFYVVALALQRRTGGGIAETLANLSYIIRRRKELRLKARALTAEAKASAAVLGLLPFVVGGLLFFLNGQLMSVLFVDSRGRFVLGLAILSVLTGVAVMTAIIKRSLR